MNLVFISNLPQVEYLKNPTECFKRFKTCKDGLITKVKEIDGVCGSKSTPRRSVPTIRETPTWSRGSSRWG